MSTKLLTVILAIVCLVQAETPAEVVAELKQKIALLQDRIKIAIEDDGHRIGETRSAISQSVTDARATLIQDLDQLQSAVTEAQNQAEIDNKDILACLDAESAAEAQINVQDLQLCSQSSELSRLGFQLGQLGRVRGTLEQSINLCTKLHRADVAALRKCIEDDIARAEQRVDDVQKEIDGILDGSVEAANECVQQTVQSLEAGVQDISKELNSCVEQAPNQL